LRPCIFSLICGKSNIVFPFVVYNLDK